MSSQDQFAAFVREAHGHDPFPWQQRLAEQVIRQGWPSVVGVQTGLGKTSTLDIAVFAAAQNPAGAARRVCFLVDRRIVVDEAYEHARRIATALNNPCGPATKSIAAALLQPGDDVPLAVTRMRGGVTWDRQWAVRPDRFAIVCGTVDQLGSRLLFRGYGVSAAGRPIDAALVGVDSLILVDEAHQAEPLITTLDAAVSLGGDRSVRPAPQLVQVTATSSSPDVFTIDQQDTSHPVAGRRLRAAKCMHLVAVKATKAKAYEAQTSALTTLTTQLAAPGTVIAAVCNTVGRARAVHSQLATLCPQADVVLLTGRSREPDRAAWMARHFPHAATGRHTPPEARPLIVVATQTVEVGANLDFDHLVTECADLAALWQRAGRVNRLGDRAEGTIVVVHCDAAPDPVYGSSAQATWDFLAERTNPAVFSPKDPIAFGDTHRGAGLAVSPADVPELTAAAPAQVRPQARYVPVLLPAVLESWTRTNPAPHPDTPVAPYLHGADDTAEPVVIVWRHGLPWHDANAEAWAEHVELLPPAAGEAVELPIAAVRGWLGGLPPPPVSDLDTAPHPGVDRQPAANGRQVLSWDPEGEHRLVGANAVTPGMTIIVPAGYGGCDCYGWHPASTLPVADVADVAHRSQGAILRIGPTLDSLIDEYADLLVGPDAAITVTAALRALASAQETDSAAYADLIGQLARAAGTASPLGRTLSAMALRKLNVVLWPGPGSGPWQAIISTTDGMDLADDETTAASSASGHPQTLAEHQQAVARRARQFATNLGLPDHLVRACELAAALHDEGKRDPRFQIMLHEGDKLAAMIAEEPLAKSGMNPADRVTQHQARRRSGYPHGMRHEALSERIATDQISARSDVDVDLVLHLVVSHHGHARPILPAVADPNPVTITVNGNNHWSHMPFNWDHPNRFAALNARYGPWQLALLETIVRLADRYESSRRNERTH